MALVGPNPVGALLPTQLASIAAASSTPVLLTATDQGFGNLNIQITGTWTGTIGFYCGLDGVFANAVAMAVYSAGTSPATTVTTTTGNGVFRTIDATGLNMYIASTSATWTGTAVVWTFWNAIR